MVNLKNKSMNKEVSKSFLKAKRMIVNAKPLQYEMVLNYTLLFLRTCKNEYEKSEVINLYKKHISQC